MLEKGLNKTKLQYLAIFAMVIDHIAWGFVDFMSPLGQAMHIFGRLTLPIMCFFIAEGYKRTSNLKRYIFRMVFFAIISVLPFYVFFHQEYGFRQNIIFDLTLALLALATMENREWSKTKRWTICAILFVISFVIGGWVIMPIIYVLVFYYGKDFKTKAKWFCLSTLLMETILCTLIVLNQKYHFSKYDWTVEERLYLLGFMLALIPLYFYNGRKGKNICGKNFFYCFYPAHFLVLSFIKYYLVNYSVQRMYIIVHVIALLICLGNLLYVVVLRHSRAQMATALFMLSSVMYIYGFLLEITTSEVAGVYTATKLQYFGECLVFIFLTLTIQELCHSKIPKFVYASEVVFSIFTMYCMFTYEENGLMYSGITMSSANGAFPRMQIESYGLVFYLFITYAVIVCLYAIFLGLKVAKESELEKRRLRNLLYAMIIMWLPYLIKATNITHGYEIPAVGVAFASIFVGRTLGKYGYLDSVNLSGDNALNFGKEGIIVINRQHIILYHNEWIHSIFGALEDYDDAFKIEGVKEAFSGKNKTLEKDGHTFELRVEPMIENGEEQGKILWVFDLTDHYKYLDIVKLNAKMDALTGIYNRGSFENQVTEHLESGKSGAFYMFDMDNFKSVNDTYGHQVGDEVLMRFAEVLKNLSGEEVIPGRMGGDEFCLFYKNEMDKDLLGEVAEQIMVSFNDEMAKSEQGVITSVSVGIAILDQTDGVNPEVPYSKLYQRADRALYSAKQSGKNSYQFYSKTK